MIQDYVEFPFLQLRYLDLVPDQCSRHPEKPNIHAFCTDVSMYWFLFQVLGHPLSNDAKEDFTLHIHVHYILGMVLFSHAVLVSLQRNLRMSGVFLYTLYGTPPIWPQG